jgi:hypothetical protein
METQKKLTKKQVRVLDDFFGESLEEPPSLKKSKVKNAVYKKWLLSDEFFEELIKRACRKTKVMIAHYSQFAAAKLIGLADSEKDEIARKACLDIITLQTAASESAERPDETGDNKSDFAISDKKASKLLAVLAEDDEE